jgi:predicted molibdopterin-dependent oxidoreductase YjgC
VIGIRSNRGRLAGPLVRVDGALRPAGWDEALDAGAAGLARARATDATRSFGTFSCAPQRGFLVAERLGCPLPSAS